MPQQLSDPEDLVRALRPDLPADPVWADAALARVLATPRPRPRRRRWVVGGAALATFAVGGGAYAGGLVPSVVVDRLGQGDQSEPLMRIGDVREVFSLTTADGSVVQFFVAPNEAGGECVAVTHDLDRGTEPGDFGFGCAAGGLLGDGTVAGENGVGVLETDSEHPGPPVLFGIIGQHTSTWPVGTTSVRVTGPGFTRSVPATKPEGWALELPSGPAAYLVEMVAADGSVLQTTRERVRS
ncbi:hypothetical protein [Nocardioides sp. W7]|uniref:hypothetical protein n=1 Tax=Nocardioides sp. W7 TaxID=2931390 RepID=UPI001FD320B8|nr:hypothetical protein [Nocardioides sp. W7]